MAETLAFTITGRDRLGEKLDILARKVDKVSDRLTRLDHKRAEPKVDIDVDKPLRKIDGFADSSSGVMSGALKIVTSNAIVMGAAVVGALAAAPAAAALAATGIVAALGGGLAGIGILAAAQSKKVQKAFTDLKDDVVKQVKEMAAPFEPALVRIAEIGQRTFTAFAKPLEDSFARLAPAITVFADQFGRALEGLAPAIRPVSDAFTAILRQLGPRLPELFKSLGDSIAHIAKVVEDNADTFAGLINFFLRMIPIAIDVTAKLAAFFAAIVRNAPAVAESFLGAVEGILKGVRVVSDAVLDFFGDILDGATKAFGWVPIWGDNLKQAQADFNTFRGGVGKSLDGAIGKVDEWRRSVDRMPKRIKLEGDIRDLQGKIEAAKAKLKTVPESKQTQVRAEISQLQAQLRRAKAELASLHDKTVTVTMRVQQLLSTAPARVRQHGGPAQARQAYVVGEAGPELFVPNTGGMVIPNQRIRQETGGGGGGWVAGGIDAKELADAIVAALRRAPLVVTVDDMHAGLLGKKNRQGGMSLGLS